MNYQIEFSNYLIEKSQALKAVFIYIGLDVKLFEIGYRSKHDCYAIVFFMIDLLQ